MLEMMDHVTGEFRGWVWARCNTAEPREYVERKLPWQ
jgi:hypothetical protein